MNSETDIFLSANAPGGDYGKIDEADLARRLGLPLEDVQAVTNVYPLPVVGFRRLQEEERGAFYKTIVDYLTVMDRTEGVQTTPGNWQSEWGRVRDRVLAEGPSVETLRPDYFHYKTLRLDGEYAFTDDPLFEHHAYIAILRLLFATYLPKAERVIDLGCGTGTSLYLLNQLGPGRELIGGDWVPESQETVNAIGAATGENIRGVHFNMQTLDGADALPFKGAAVTTLHAMEQLGTAHQPLLDLLMAHSPTLVLHLEPVEEFYDPDNLFDQVALTHHRQREYLSGYLTRLRQLASDGRIELLAERRLYLGSTWHEAYSLIVWRPVSSLKT